MNQSAGTPPPDITSPTNPHIKRLVALRKRRSREADAATLVEGRDEITLALSGRAAPRQLLYAPDLVSAEGRAELLDQATSRGASVRTLSREAFARASYRESPDGWLAIFDDPAQELHSLVLSDNPLVLVCEGIEKPGNLGAMLRTAEAAGVCAVIAASPVADWGNPNVVRASKGTVFAIPVASAPAGEVVDWLRAHDVAIVVATPDTEELLTDLELTGPLAVVVGAEHAGVTADWLTHADHTARLPMFGQVNSLNVAATAAIALYEALRQRQAIRLL